MGLVAACGPATSTGRGGSPATPRPFGSAISIHAWFDLPDDSRSRELSGIAWDEGTRTLWGVQDESAKIVQLVPDRDLKNWSFGPMIELKMAFPVDLEGIVILQDGFIVASEKGPRLLEIDRKGKLRRDIALPAHFANARDNKSLESLAMSPGGRFLFTTTEGALSSDGENATPNAGARVRVLRIPRDTGEVVENAYATDPAPHGIGDYGVADMAAISNDDLLVLERGWTRGSGNTARIYRVSTNDAASMCLGNPALAADAPVMEKKLVVDLAKLVVSGLPALKQPQDSPLLDNFEGLAIGPVLPDGRRTLILVSDDNGRTDQFARIVVLAVG